MLGEVGSQNKEYREKDFSETGAMRLLTALKAQTVQDYIDAVDRGDSRTIRECEIFLGYCGKLETAKYSVNFIVPLFKALAMEHIPEKWEDDNYKTFTCPICKAGKARITFQSAIKRKYYLQLPSLRYSCSNCGYVYDITLLNTTETELEIVKKEKKHESFQLRMRCYNGEFDYQIRKNPNMSPQERDELARRLAKKWNV